MYCIFRVEYRQCFHRYKRRQKWRLYCSWSESWYRKFWGKLLTIFKNHIQFFFVEIKTKYTFHIVTMPSFISIFITMQCDHKHVVILWVSLIMINVFFKLKTINIWRYILYRHENFDKLSNYLIFNLFFSPCWYFIQSNETRRVTSPIKW